MAGLSLLLRRGGLAPHPVMNDYILSENKGDAEVFRVLMVKGVSSDGIGITEEDAAKVTSVKGWFAGNKTIKNFDEFRFFTSVTSLDYTCFKGCTSLTSIIMPNTIKTLDSETFMNCTSLENCPLPESVETIGTDVFKATKIGGVINLPNLKSLGYYNKFSSTNITGIKSLGLVTNFGTSVNDSATLAANCKQLQYAILPETLTTLSRGAFYNCTALQYIIVKATTPPALETSSALSNTNNCPIYVPDGSVAAYKEKAVWVNFAARIKPLSEYNG